MKREELKTKLGNIEEIQEFANSVLEKNDSSRRNRFETMLVIEAVYNDMIDQGVDPETEVEIFASQSFGEIKLILGHDGKLFTPNPDGEASVNNLVMKGYGDKIDYRYHSGRNTISITIKRKYIKSFTMCFLGLLLAFIAYIPMKLFMSPESLAFLSDQIIMPVEKMFINAVLMIGAPVTFFSLLRNITDAYIVSESSSGMRYIQRKTIQTSIVAIFLAVLTGFAIIATAGNLHRFVSGISEMGLHKSIGEIIESLVPSNIFAPFEEIMPFPLILFALMTAYAFCSVGQYFDTLKKATDVCYTLFSKMLTAIIYTLPFFAFLAGLDILLGDGLLGMIDIILIAVIVLLSLSVMALYYIIRLKVSGVEVKEFIKNMKPILRENLLINSAIDAVPFNVRYCARKFGLDRKKLEASLSTLAQLNLDGNCFLIMLVTLIYIFAVGATVSWLNLIAIGALVLFLSLGAPNQPGSVLIGFLIIANYLKAYDILAVAIYSEVFFGSLLNLVNVTGDIVTVVVEDDRLKA